MLTRPYLRVTPISGSRSTNPPRLLGPHLPCPPPTRRRPPPPAASHTQGARPPATPPRCHPARRPRYSPSALLTTRPHTPANPSPVLSMKFSLLLLALCATVTSALPRLHSKVIAPKAMVQANIQPSAESALSLRGGFIEAELYKKVSARDNYVGPRDAMQRGAGILAPPLRPCHRTPHS